MITEHDIWNTKKTPLYKIQNMYKFFSSFPLSLFSYSHPCCFMSLSSPTHPAATNHRFLSPALALAQAPPSPPPPSSNILLKSISHQPPLSSLSLSTTTTAWTLTHNHYRHQYQPAFHLPFRFGPPPPRHYHHHETEIQRGRNIDKSWW